MRRRLMQSTVAVAVLFAAAQVIRPDRNNPPTDPGRTIQAHAGTTRELACRPGSLVPRLSLQQHRVAAVHASRAVVVADGAGRGGKTEGGQLGASLLSV